jgi:hypothetical protein
MRHTVRAVQVDGRSHVSAIDEPHHSLTPFLHTECGSWRDAIIADEFRFLETATAIYFLFECFDLHFVVVDVSVCSSPFST